MAMYAYRSERLSCAASAKIEARTGERDDWHPISSAPVLREARAVSENSAGGNEPLLAGMRVQALGRQLGQLLVLLSQVWALHNRPEL